MMINLKLKFRQLLISLLLLNCFYSTAQNALTRIYLKDACQQKKITNAVVSLEAYQKDPIIAKFDKKHKYYYFKNIPDDYNTIFVNHKDFEVEGYPKIDSFPQRIDLMLHCKGNIREIDIREKTYRINENGISSDTVKIDTSFTGVIKVRDNYKVRISLKNSYKLSYNEVKRKIDSIVAPYGLEYIDDLVPNLLFVHVDTQLFDIKENQSYRPDELDKNQPMIALLEDPQSIFSDSFMTIASGDPRVLESFYYQLLYRKKDKSAFQSDYDLLLQNISEKNKNLKIDLMSYYKFLIDEKYPLKINCKNLSKYDNQIMNYQFFSKYGNDPTRVLLMDPYFMYEDTFLGKYELDMRINGEVRYTPPVSDKKSNFRYKLELLKQ
ncbi:MAG: hypothetical protein EOO44_12255 [Flavobacterium sp.]|nr:MAG: hypothetical protein EOO44_12255 [Flavobacterium sp.]